MRKRMPFNGDFIDKDGNTRNLIAGGTAPADSPKHTISPFNGSFYAADGSVHDVDELFNGGGAGWRNIFNDSSGNGVETIDFGANNPFETGKMYAITTRLHIESEFELRELSKTHIFRFTAGGSPGGNPYGYVYLVRDSRIGASSGYITFAHCDIKLYGTPEEQSAYRVNVDSSKTSAGLATGSGYSSGEGYRILNIWEIPTAE